MKRPPPLVLFVALAGAAAGLTSLNAIPIGVFHDDGQYLILARSLAEHATYRFDNLPGAPPGLHYPPGYPAFLALLWIIAPANVQVFKCANALLLGVAAVAIYACVRRLFGLSNRAAAAVSIGVAASAPFIWLNSMLVSETLFVATLYGTLALAAAKREANARWHVAIGAMAGATALVRSLADPLGLLLVGERLVRGKRREAVVIGAAWLAVILPWKLWLHAHAHGMPAAVAGPYGEYGAWWRTAFDALGPAFIWETLSKNVAQLPAMLGVLGWSVFMPFRWMSALVFAACAAFGAWHTKREAAAAWIFASMYTAIVLIWPFEPDRFLWMLAPVAVAAFAAGVSRAWAQFMAKKGIRLWVAGAVAAVMLAGFLQTYFTMFHDRAWEHGLGQRGDKGEAAARLVTALPGDARIASDFDEIVHLETGRVLVPALGLTAAEYVRPRSDSIAAAQLDSVLVAFDITHIVVADLPTLNALRWLGAHGMPLAAVASDSGGAVVFARRPGPGTASPSPARK